MRTTPTTAPHDATSGLPACSGGPVGSGGSGELDWP